MCDRHKIGVVTGPPPTAEINISKAANMASQDVVVVKKAKKLNLRTIINMNDFEIAASQYMKPRSFACEYRSCKTSRLKLTTFQSTELVLIASTVLIGIGEVGKRFVSDLVFYGHWETLI
jgi:hypothetical protein